MKNITDKMPVVIDGPGEYVTRDGRRVTIYNIDGKGLFSARGSIWKMFRGKVRPRTFEIWHVSGRNMPLHEKPRDIVGKFEVQAVHV